MFEAEKEVFRNEENCKTMLTETEGVKPNMKTIVKSKVYIPPLLLVSLYPCV